MRRLTDFERNIVSEINEKKEVEFTDFIRRILNDEIYFRIGYHDNPDLASLSEQRREKKLEGDLPVEERYFFGAYLKLLEQGDRQIIPIPDNPSKRKAKGVLLRPNDEDGAKIFAYLHHLRTLFELFKLLEENGFIRTYHAMEKDNPLPLLHVMLGDDSIENSYHACYYLREPELKMDLLYYSWSFSRANPALEIYVNHGFRTEEQKANDETIAHNEITRKQAQKATRIAANSARQARNAVYATVGLGVGTLILGAATLMYSCHRDNEKDAAEETAKIEQAEAKKSEDFYRVKMIKQGDRMTEAIEGIKKNLKPASQRKPAKSQPTIKQP